MKYPSIRSLLAGAGLILLSALPALSATKKLTPHWKNKSGADWRLMTVLDDRSGQKQSGFIVFRLKSKPSEVDGALKAVDETFLFKNDVEYTTEVNTDPDGKLNINFQVVDSNGNWVKVRATLSGGKLNLEALRTNDPDFLLSDAKFAVSVTDGELWPMLKELKPKPGSRAAERSQSKPATPESDS